MCSSDLGEIHGDQPQRGMTRRHLGHQLAEAREAGRDGIDLTTVPSNLRARRLYGSRGFRAAGEVDKIAGDGRVVRELRLVLSFRPGAAPGSRAFSPPR